MNFFTLVAILPQLLGLISRFMDLMKNKSAQEAAAHLSQINQSLDLAAAAQTPEDHATAAKAIALALAGKKE